MLNSLFYSNFLMENKSLYSVLGMKCQNQLNIYFERIWGRTIDATFFTFFPNKYFNDNIIIAI